MWPSVMSASARSCFAVRSCARASSAQARAEVRKVSRYEGMRSTCGTEYKVDTVEYKVQEGLAVEKSSSAAKGQGVAVGRQRAAPRAA